MRPTTALMVTACLLGLVPLVGGAAYPSADTGRAASASPEPPGVPSADGGPADPVRTGSGRASGPAHAPSRRMSGQPAADPWTVAAKAAQNYVEGRTGLAAFTIVDSRSGRVFSSDRAAEQTSIESVVKVWLAADLLLQAQQGRRPPPTGTERFLLDIMIRNSDDDAAGTIHRMLGSDASLRRMIGTCGLTDTTIVAGEWSVTQISARDIARLGRCIQPGVRLGPASAHLLLTLMRTVAPSNAFGIQEAYPAGKGVRIPVKNGWTAHGGTDSGVWSVNCLGMWGPGLRSVLGVTTRYPQALGLRYGAATCRQVTAILSRRGTG